MSTRATVHFQYNGRTDAIVYRHSDGYPDGLGKDLSRFLDEIGALQDTRFGDSCYLAAKFIVWQTLEYASSEFGAEDPVAVIGIGVVQKDPGDIEYRYKVNCTSGSKRPEIKTEEV